MQKIFPIFIIGFLITLSLSAKDKTYKWSTKRKSSNNINSVMESSLLQFAVAKRGNKDLTTIPRYTYFFNTGFEANFKVDNGVKVFTGLGVKNIGLIIKNNDSSRIKHRVYTVGAPFGFKFHDNQHVVGFKIGVDVSMAFNYKWKLCVNDKKTKSSEWFSSRTSLFHPSLFAGINVYGFSLNANYYLNNFFNPLIPAVSDMDARLFTIGIGLNMDTKMKSKKKSKDSDAS